MTSDDDYLKELWSNPKEEPKLTDKQLRLMESYVSTLTYSSKVLEDLSVTFQGVRDWHMSNEADNLAFGITRMIDYINLCVKNEER